MDELTGFWESGLLSALKGMGVGHSQEQGCHLRPGSGPCNQGQVTLATCQPPWLKAMVIKSCVTKNTASGTTP